MKIIFVNRYFSPDHSGSSQMLTDLACWLVRSGWNVHVVTSRQRYDNAKANLSGRETIRGVIVDRVWTSRFGRGNLLLRTVDYICFYLAALCRLLWIVDSDDLVIAATDPPLISVVAGFAVWIKGARLVNWIQDLFPEVCIGLRVGVLRGAIGRFATMIRDRSLHLAVANVQLGSRMAAKVKGRGVAPERVITIHNWADDRSITPISHEMNSLRQEWGLDGKFVVLYSGNFGRAHEFAAILDAARRLDEASEIAFLFIGDGAKMSAVSQYATLHRLRNLTIRGYQAREDLPLSLGAGDLHLVSLAPSMEGLMVPCKFYAAAAAGRAIAFIGDCDGEIGCLVRKFECGKSFSIDDGAVLADFIRHLANNREECARLGRNARAGLDREFSQAFAFQCWEAVISHVATHRIERLDEVKEHF